MTSSDQVIVIEETLEPRLDRWAVDHLEAAIELREIVRRMVLVDKVAGWRVVGKAIANLEVPDAASGPQARVSRRKREVV